MRKLIMMFLVVLYATIAVAQKPTRQEFVAVCDSLGVKHPNVVWAQARLESGNFESKTYRQKHNCLGIYDKVGKFWVDMESSLRNTDDKFDLDVV